MHENNSNYLNFKELAVKYPSFTEWSFRNYYRKNHYNFRKVVRKINSRLLINESEFIKWLEERKM